jgi:hypothetical protein
MSLAVALHPVHAREAAGVAIGKLRCLFDNRKGA